VAGDVETTGAEMQQLAGADRREALVAVPEFFYPAPKVAHRAEFDRAVLDPALEEDLSLRAMQRWPGKR
jgi:hypothetical protein